MRILVIEDDRKAADLLARGLQEEGLVVDVASTGAGGDEMASVNAYAVIILDWLLPDREGIVVCRDLRRRGISTPILMLTARDALDDRVTGLDAGADDYLVKPFGFSELMARVRALLRRSEQVPCPFPHVVIDRPIRHEPRSVGEVAGPPAQDRIELRQHLFPRRLVG